MESNKFTTNHMEIDESVDVPMEVTNDEEDTKEIVMEEHMDVE